MNLKNKEQAFLQYYVAAGQSAQRKIECYRLAFGKEVENVMDSSIDTYAKRVLAKPEAKEFLNKHRPSNTLRSEELLDAIKELKELLDRAKNAKEEIDIRREIRMHLADLGKCVDQVPVAKEDEWIFSDDRVMINQPKRNKNGLHGFEESQESDDEYAAKCLAKDILRLKEPTLFYFKDGQFSHLLPLFPHHPQEERKALQEGIESGDFYIAVRK